MIYWQVFLISGKYEVNTVTVHSNKCMKIVENQMINNLRVQFLENIASPKNPGAHRLQACPAVLFTHLRHDPVILSQEPGSSMLIFPEQLQGLQEPPEILHLKIILLCQLLDKVMLIEAKSFLL